MPISRHKFFFSAGSCVMCALMLLALPLQWLFAAVFAAMFHEFCHAITVYFCTGRVIAVHVGQKGACMKAQMLTHGEELICTLAGPMGSLLLLLLVRFIPRISFCAAVHGIYNFLPLSNLDGGKVLYKTLYFLRVDNGHNICAIVQWVTIAILWLLAIYLAFYLKLGLFPLLLTLGLTIDAKKDLANLA